MKVREAQGLTAALLCLSVAFLRMFAPALPFDWMTLALVLAAAVVICLPAAVPARVVHVGAEAQAPFVPAEMSALSARMEHSSWQAQEGGLFDALTALNEQKPFAALCAARGMLAMLIGRTQPPAEEAATLSLLADAMDSLAAAGEASADGASVKALFAFALRALSYLEQLS